jgi:regulator of sigma E protease
MSVIIFLIVLSVLVLVHELGHFSVAKYFGIRVDEFGLGYPPRAKKLFSWRGTDFSLNWLPFGGFVKIFGENPTGEENELRDPQSFVSKNRSIQAFVLVAGVTANFIFAWFLISFGFMLGMPAPEGLGLPVSHVQTVITEVRSGSPAELAGLKSGDAILSVSGLGSISPEDITGYINTSSGPVTLYVQRGGEQLTLHATPAEGIVEGRKAIGVGMDSIGVAKLPFFSAISHGLSFTWKLTKLTAVALGSFILHAFIGQADLSQVTGPVGLVGIVGDVSSLGFVYLISFTALISINLALVNLLPFPALDGGRLLFVLIESIARRPIPPKIFNAANGIGFAFLILLMIIITFRDVSNLI